MPALSYCGDIVRTGDRDRFLLSLFVPAGAREGVLAIYALNLELAHIRKAVSEEMIGHIRHAWWQEAVEKVYARLPHPHPALAALDAVADTLPPADVMALCDSYRSHFPDLPPDGDALTDALAEKWVRAACPGALAGWEKARTIIAAHRRRYGRRGNGWLSAKLLLAGMV